MTAPLPGRRPWHPPWWLGAVFVVLLAVPAVAWASDAGIRLGLLFNFTKFSEWPAGTFAQSGSPLTICLAKGDDDMAAGLSALEQRTVQGHPVRTALISRPNQAGGCHVLYLPAELPGRISDYVQAAGNSRTLTVSDASDFIDEGGMIGLILDDNRYVFEINNELVRRSQLHINAQVLKLARRVK